MPPAEDVVAAEPPRSRRGRWLAVAIVAGLAVVYLAAVRSTHGAHPAHPALSAVVYGEVRTDGEANIGFTMHNGGPVPITLLSVALAGPQFPAAAVAELGPVGVANASPGQMTRFHPVTLGPGDTVDAALIEPGTCGPATGGAATSAREPVQAAVSPGEVTGTVVVRYRVLGVTTSRMFGPTSPLQVLLPGNDCA